MHRESCHHVTSGHLFTLQESLHRIPFRFTFTSLLLSLRSEGYGDEGREEPRDRREGATRGPVVTASYLLPTGVTPLRSSSYTGRGSFRSPLRVSLLTTRDRNPRPSSRLFPRFVWLRVSPRLVPHLRPLRDVMRERMESGAVSGERRGDSRSQGNQQ